MRRFNAEVGQMVLWDDHEVRDNWYPTRDLTKDHEVHTVKSMALWPRARGRRSSNTTPSRSNADDGERIYRNGRLRPARRGLRARSAQLPRREQREPASRRWPRTRPWRAPLQLEWLKTRLAASRATWKVIASDMPIGVVVPDATVVFRGIRQRRRWPERSDASSRLRTCSSSSRTAASANVVWITADIHYCAAHHYHPTRAKFTDFDPFWEFVAGPLNAGTFGPNKMDATFGPEVKFTGIPPGMKPNRPPSDGFQFFGQMRIDRRTKAMTVSLHDLSGRKIYSQELGAEKLGARRAIAHAESRFHAIATLAFLRALKRNNDREWFRAQKDRYERDVREPMIRVIERLATDFKSFATGARRRSKDLPLSNLPRHALQPRQDAAQDERRGEFSVARAAPASGRGALFRDRADMGVDWRRHVRAGAAASREGPRAHRRDVAGDSYADARPGVCGLDSKRSAASS